MKTINNDIRNYDTLKLYVKTNKVDEIISSYSKLMWTLTEKTENAKYEDIVDLTFTRPHKIKNKDELQLLQIYLENQLNTIGKLERHKHSRSAIFGLALGLPTLLLMALGILNIFSVLTFIPFLASIIISSILAVAVLAEAIVLKKLIKKESLVFVQKYIKLEDELDLILEKASKLTGECNEKI